jgi:hypothetical protein
VNEIVVEFEKNLFIVDNSLIVYVLSNGDWVWALAWHQMGISQVRCIALTENAKAELIALREHSIWKRCLQPWDEMSPIPEEPRVVSCHLTDHDPVVGPGMLERCIELTGTRDTLMMASICFGRNWTKNVKSKLGKDWTWQTVRHQSIGGLTSAYRDMGVASSGARPWEARINAGAHPKRPAGRFLEPSIKLEKQSVVVDRSVPCWRPIVNDEPCPWPWGNSELIVEAPTCYTGRGIRDGLVRRKVTAREKMQLLDLNEDWGDKLASSVWNWNKGGPTPLRIVAEFVRIIDHELQGREENRETGKGQGDGRATAPLEPQGTKVGDLGDLSDIGALRRKEYFGMVWESHAANITGAAKADDAVVDVSLWAVGGDGPGMESAREVLRKALFRKWRRRLVLEAARWLQSEEAQEEYTANQAALCDCIRRCAHSSWWEWTDGSRLLFWRWPQAWRREARDGARGYHTVCPKSRLKYPQVPIKEQWIVDKDLEKLEKLLRRRYIVPSAVYCTRTREKHGAALSSAKRGGRHSCRLGSCKEWIK